MDTKELRSRLKNGEKFELCESAGVASSAKNTLLCCPFCGSKAELRSDSDEVSMDGKLPYWVCCTRCMGNTGSHYEPEGAADTWNTRAP